MKLNEIKNIIKNFHENCNLTDEYCFEDILEFLINSQFESVPIILYDDGIFLNSLIVSKDCLENDFVEELLDWNFRVSSYGYSVSSKEEYKLSNPCDSYSPRKILKDATPLFLERYVFNDTKSIIEFNQKISHRLGVAELNNKNQFYRMDEYGDIMEVASIIKKDNLTLCLLDKKELDKYLHISNSVLVRFFDIYILDKANPWNSSEEIIRLDDKDIYYKNVVQHSNDDMITLKEIRGFQIIKPISEFKNNYDEVNYQEFKVLDLRLGSVVTNSCDPSKLGNIVNKFDGVPEISPVFFRTEVFNKYNDSEKYDVDNRYIECKGIWSLRYSMSDDKTQVIVYIGDLGKLPEFEQIYWKSFNVEPKSNIAEHIFKTDFLGEWDDVLDPLISLKQCLSDFPSCYIGEVEIKIWVEKNKGNIRKLGNLHYIKHPTKENWDFEVKKLHQIVVEGFCGKNIDKIAKNLDCYDEKLRSLKQLKKCIIKLYDENTANVIIDPLLQLNDDRNSSGHAKNGEIYPKDVIQDYNSKIKACFLSMKWLSDKINEGKFNFK